MKSVVLLLVCLVCFPWLVLGAAKYFEFNVVYDENSCANTYVSLVPIGEINPVKVSCVQTGFSNCTCSYDDYLIDVIYETGTPSECWLRQMIGSGTIKKRAQMGDPYRYHCRFYDPRDQINCEEPIRPNTCPYPPGNARYTDYCENQDPGNLVIGTVDTNPTCPDSDPRVIQGCAPTSWNTGSCSVCGNTYGERFGSRWGNKMILEDDCWHNPSYPNTCYQMYRMQCGLLEDDTCSAATDICNSACFPGTTCVVNNTNCSWQCRINDCPDVCANKNPCGFGESCTITSQDGFCQTTCRKQTPGATVLQVQLVIEWYDQPRATLISGYFSQVAVRAGILKGFVINNADVQKMAGHNLFWSVILGIRADTQTARVNLMNTLLTYLARATLGPDVGINSVDDEGVSLSTLKISMSNSSLNYTVQSITTQSCSDGSEISASDDCPIDNTFPPSPSVASSNSNLIKTLVPSIIGAVLVLLLVVVITLRIRRHRATQMVKPQATPSVVGVELAQASRE